MHYDLSDDEFCETNFAEPSPIKKRSALLPDPSVLKMKLEKLSELKSRMKKTDAELFSFFKNKLGNNSSDLLKTGECDALNVIKSNEETIKLLPDGRNFFFEDQCLSNDSLQPSKLFSPDSIFYNLTLDNFRSLVTNRVLVSRTEYPDKEFRSLVLFCFQFLKIESDVLITSLILQFLNSQPLPFEIINLRTLYSPSFPRLLEILERSLPAYSPSECQILFHEGCLAALDRKTFLNLHVFPSFLTTCLEGSSKKNMIDNEIDWLIQLNVEPEENSHLLKILPQNGVFKNFGLQFAFRALQKILGSANINKCISHQELSALLVENDKKFCDLSLTAVFHILNFTNYIILKLPTKEENLIFLEEILKFVEGLKLRYREKGSTIHTYILNEYINRLYLTVQQRIQVVIRQAPAEIQCRSKLFFHNG